MARATKPTTSDSAVPGPIKPNTVKNTVVKKTVPKKVTAKKVAAKKPGTIKSTVPVPTVPKAMATAPEINISPEPAKPMTPKSAKNIARKPLDRPAEPAPPQPGARRRRPAVILICLLVLAGAVAYGRHYYTNRPRYTDAANKSLIAQVAERAVLPEGEKPTVSTVVDKDKANQSFLLNAHNGDKVLLYFQTGRAILYRPSTHQIVNMGPLSQPPAQVFLRDGAAGDTPGSLRDKLTPTAGFTVVSQDVATTQTYTQTLVVDLHGNRPDLASRVARLIGGQVSLLPGNETAPDADILVIRGSDSK